MLGSVAAHAVLVLLLVLAYGGWLVPAPERTLNLLLDVPVALPSAPPRYESPPPPAERGGRPLAMPRQAADMPRPEQPVESGEPGAAPEPGGARGGVAGGRPGGRGVAALTPQFTDSRVWVRPNYIPPRPLDDRPLDMDSIARRRLLAIADSIQRNPTGSPDRVPSWTFERNGRTYGIDERGIHLGAFTIPTAVLALVPVPQGNIDQARMNQRIAELRAEIMRAAARAEGEDEFRRAVREIRARVDREREERRRREREAAERERARPEDQRPRP